MLKYVQISPFRRKNRPHLTKFQRMTLRSADQARDRKSWQEAAVFYHRYLEEVSADAAIWTQLGHALKEAKNLGDAEAAYRTGLAFAPWDAELHLQLGYLLKIQGRFQEAEQAFLKSSTLDPTLGAKAEITWLKSLGTYTPAPELPATAAISDPTAPAADPPSLQMQGDEARDRSDWENAGQYYEAFLRLAPGRGDIWVQFGHSLRELGNLSAAERAYRTAVEINAGDADAQFQLGHALKMQQRMAEAKEAFARASALDAGLNAQQELDQLNYEHDVLHNKHDGVHNVSDRGAVILSRFQASLARRRH